MRATVLIVDDDPDIRLALRVFLRDEGFEVREARNGLEALEQIANEEPDLVLLDLIMPIINGWDVLKTLRRARKELPVVILSAVPAERGVDYLRKPVSVERLHELLMTIRGKLEARAAGA